MTAFTSPFPFHPPSLLWREVEGHLTGFLFEIHTLGSLFTIIGENLLLLLPLHRPSTPCCWKLTASMKNSLINIENHWQIYVRWRSGGIYFFANIYATNIIHKIYQSGKINIPMSDTMWRVHIIINANFSTSDPPTWPLLWRMDHLDAFLYSFPYFTYFKF